MLCKQACDETFKQMWVLKVPAKTKTSLWGLMWGRTLTKDNMFKRGWESDGQCVFLCKDMKVYTTCFLMRPIWSIPNVLTILQLNHVEWLNWGLAY
jgi:hypothetical protein